MLKREQAQLGPSGQTVSGCTAEEHWRHHFEAGGKNLPMGTMETLLKMKQASPGGAGRERNPIPEERTHSFVD